MIARAPRRSISAYGRVVREQLRVDVELAHPARDQLGELAPEVEDDDRTRAWSVRRPVGRPPGPAPVR